MHYSLEYYLGVEQEGNEGYGNEDDDLDEEDDDDEEKDSKKKKKSKEKEKSKSKGKGKDTPAEKPECKQQWLIWLCKIAVFVKI